MQTKSESTIKFRETNSKDRYDEKYNEDWSIKRTKNMEYFQRKKAKHSF